MLDWITNLTQEVITLARIVIVLVAIVSVIITYYRTQALVPVVSAALVAGIAIWAVSPTGLTQLESWIGDDAVDGVPGRVVGMAEDHPGAGSVMFVVGSADDLGEVA